MRKWEVWVGSVELLEWFFGFVHSLSYHWDLSTDPVPYKIRVWIRPLNLGEKKCTHIQIQMWNACTGLMSDHKVPDPIGSGSMALVWDTCPVLPDLARVASFSTDTRFGIVGTAANSLRKFSCYLQGFGSVFVFTDLDPHFKINEDPDPGLYFGPALTKN